MSAKIEQRKLAAIMFTDMVGYSALAQRSDKLALELLEEHREILRKIFPQFNGTEVKTIGDAFLVEFQSALEAAQCAIAIQRSLAKHNADAPAERQMKVKIGIHIGDVVHRGGDVYGDGVNIASRIEPLAGPGGICVSVDVERQIRNAVETRFEKLGPTELKNISVPMELFRIVLPWEGQTPENRGQRTEVRKGGVSSAHSCWIWSAAGVALALLLITAAGWWWFGSYPTKAKVGTSLRDVREVEQGRPGGASLPIPEKSIAVLPFENLSDDKSNAYFAEGIQDEILTRLSKIADLKVISRTSTQKYKSAPDNLREVGKQLGVANLLEGSVQKVGQAVHINVQLIKAATDAHIWAESYDRQLQNIFGVEGEVAAAIAQQLKAKLTGTEEKAIANKPTENAAAYDAYLRGVSMENMRAVSGAAQTAAAAYTEAIQLDPKFALAWARLAITRSYLYFNGIDPVMNSAGAVKEAADQAFTLQPDLGEAWVAQGVYRYRVLRDFPAALKSYAEALRRLPNSSLVFEQMAHVEQRLGQLDAAKKHYLMASQLDPRNIEILFTLSDLYETLRNFHDAESVLDRILQLSPGNEIAICTKAFIYQSEGRLDQSAKELGKISADSDDENVVIARVFQLVDERRFDAAIAQIEPVASSKTSEPRVVLLLGYCQEWAGRKPEARATFVRVISEIKPSPETVVPIDARQLLCYLAWAYAGIDDKENALKAAREAVEKYRNDVLAKAFADQTLAIVQARFGDADAAIAALPHLLEVPNGITISDLRLSPFWDPLRKDPRFIKLTAESATPNH